MKKAVCVALSISLGSMIFLYIIGFFADVDFLTFKISTTHMEIGLLPIGVGLLVAGIFDRVMKNRYIKK